MSDLYMEKAEQIARDLLYFASARSVFLYGSRARTDFYEESDYEIGVLMDREKYVSRADIKARFDIEGVSIFPFYYDEFVAGNPDTPFQKALYMRDIVQAGKTLAGEKVIENLKVPEIRLLDSLQEVRFNLGYALAATHSYRNGDHATAALHFVKSCLFGTRNYLIFKTGKFWITYDDILATAKELDLGGYKDLPEHAFRLRKRNAEVDGQKLFQNISYLNKFIEKELSTAFAEKGNMILVA